MISPELTLALIALVILLAPILLWMVLARIASRIRNKR
jgi:hypothetical protein